MFHYGCAVLVSAQDLVGVLDVDEKTARPGREKQQHVPSVFGTIQQHKGRLGCAYPPCQCVGGYDGAFAGRFLGVASLEERQAQSSGRLQLGDQIRKHRYQAHVCTQDRAAVVYDGVIDAGSDSWHKLS